MKILLVSQYFFPESSRVNDMALGMQELGHEVTVFSGIPNYPEGRFFKGYGLFRKRHEEYQGIKIIRVPLIPRGRGHRIGLVLNYLSFAICGSLLAPFLCREKYDLIFVYQLSPITMAFPAIVIKKLRRIPLVMYVLDLWPESVAAVGAATSKSFIMRMLERMVRFIYHRCDRILVSSRGFIGNISAKGVPATRIEYWPQWAEEFYQPLTPDSTWPEAKAMPEGFRVMFAGNIGAAQSFETILTAAEILKDHSRIHWVVLGDGRRRAWVEAEVSRRSLAANVHLLGRKPAEQMPRYFALADALLFTLKKEEIFALTLPAKVQSYLACGRPIIAAIDGEGAAVIEEAGAGFTAPAEDAVALAQRVLRLYQLPPAQRKAMGLRGWDYSQKNFQRQSLLQQIATLLEGYETDR